MSTGSKRILVAEDNDIEALILHRFFLGLGYAVDRAKDGAEALDKYLKHFTYDLVLTDVMMPGMTGIELLVHSKELKNPPPIIVLTANRGDDAILKSLDTGAVDHIPKPINLSILKVKVEMVLGKPILPVASSTPK